MSLGISFLIALFTLYVRYFMGVEGLLLTPMLILIMMFTILSFLSLLIGLLGEISIRIYYESQGKRPYVIEKTLN